MANALGQWRDAVVQTRNLEQEAEAEQLRAQEAKHAALVIMAETVETETAAVVDTVSQRVAKMSAIADEMKRAAASTGASAQTAATAATQASANVQTVAGATEQPSGSVREIHGLAGRSAAIVSRAVAAGEQARSIIEALGQDVAQIDGITHMISDI